MEWKEQKSMQRWLTKLKTKRYAYECLQALKLHCKETGKTPDELIELRIEQISNKDPRIRAEAEETVTRIHGKIAEKAPGKAINYFRKVKSFYKHNYCALGCSEPEYDIASEVSDRRELEKLDKAKIRELCEKATLETRLAILILAESGGRIGAVINLTYADVKDDLETDVVPAVVWLKQATRKKGKTYPGFICADAVKLLRLVLRNRELKDDTRVFNNGRDGIQNFLRERGLHAHLFRKRVQTTLEDSGIPLNWVDRLLGHKPRGAQGKTYSLPPIAKLREQYSKAVSELEIYGAGERTNGLAKIFAKVLSHYLARNITETEINEVLKA